MLNILTQIEPKIGLKSTKIVKKKTLSLVQYCRKNQLLRLELTVLTTSLQ